MNFATPPGREGRTLGGERGPHELTDAPVVANGFRTDPLPAPIFQSHACGTNGRGIISIILAVLVLAWTLFTTMGLYKKGAAAQLDQAV